MNKSLITVCDNNVFYLDNSLLEKKNKVVSILKEYGFTLKDESNIVAPSGETSRIIQKKFAMINNEKYKKYGHNAKKFFAEGDIIPSKIDPELELIETGDYKRRDIFNYAKGFWSAPVSLGYGRRLDYIVWDKTTLKVIGIFGLTDPVIGIKVRDESILNLKFQDSKWFKPDRTRTTESYYLWTKEQKMDRLYNIMTAYVLGAVPPYNKYLCSKLIALLATSNKIRKDFKKRYENKKTVIRNEIKLPHLVMIDTLGAFGKSAIYNKLEGWKFINYTKGETHIHLTSNGIYDILYDIVKTFDEELLKKFKFGNGPNWKFRVVRKGLSILGLKETLLATGIKRGYYVSPFISNLGEFLSRKSDKPAFIDKSEENILRYWNEKWLAKIIK